MALGETETLATAATETEGDGDNTLDSEARRCLAVEMMTAPTNVRDLGLSLQVSELSKDLQLIPIDGNSMTRLVQTDLNQGVEGEASSFAQEPSREGSVQISRDGSGIKMGPQQVRQTHGTHR